MSQLRHKVLRIPRKRGASLAQDAPVIAAVGVSAGYEDLAVVRDVDIHVAAGEIVGLFGANGAGKTTTLLTLAGRLQPSAGEVRWLGSKTVSPVHVRARQGLALVPEGRSVIMGLSIRDNLRLGSGGVAEAVSIFPELESLLDRKAGLASGGEQQMVTLGRALARRPRALLADELALGLAPLAVERLFGVLKATAHERGCAVLLVEQRARLAFDIVDRWYLMQGGRIHAEGSAADGINHFEEQFWSAMGGESVLPPSPEATS